MPTHTAKPLLARFRCAGCNAPTALGDGALAVCRDCATETRVAERVRALRGAGRGLAGARGDAKMAITQLGRPEC